MRSVQIFYCNSSQVLGAVLPCLSVLLLAFSFLLPGFFKISLYSYAFLLRLYFFNIRPECLTGALGGDADSHTTQVSLNTEYTPLTPLPLSPPNKAVKMQLQKQIQKQKNLYIR